MRYSILTKTLSILVGVFYMSWPIGYLTNPAIATSGVVSDLAVRTQPSWYLFLVFHGLLFVVVTILSLILWRSSDRSRAALQILVAYSLYGLFTLVSSIVSLPCVSSSEVCDMTLRSYAHVLTGAAALFLLTVSFQLLMRRFIGSIYYRVLRITLVISWVVAIVNTQLMLMGYSGMFMAVSQRLFLSGFAAIAISIPIIFHKNATLSHK